MALIDELKEKLKDVETYIAARHAQIREHGSAVEELERQRWDLDVAIAALTPAPAPVEIEDSLAPEGMPECAWETVTLTEAAPADEQDDASEFAEPAPDPVLVSRDKLIFAVPETEIKWTEEAPALNADMQDEREQPVTDVAALIASGEHSYDEVAAIAYPEPQWNEPEGYAPVTNPEADALAKAHDWYDPKAVADRNRFNPWGGVSNLFGKPKVDA